MKKAVIFLAAALAVLPLAAADDLPVITVLDFKTNNVTAADMRSIISLLSSALFKTGRFRVIDVAQRDTLLKELEFSVSQCLEESCQLRIGRLLSAQQIVVGDIARVGSRFMMSARILQTETAATVASADGIYQTMDTLVDDLYRVASALAEIAGPAPAAAPAATAPLRVAILIPLTGGAAAYGLSAREGALLAVSEANARGGVLGRRVETVVEDGRCEGEAASQAVRKLLAAGIRLIVGEVCSSASIPAARLANDSGALFLSPTSTNRAVTADGPSGTLPFVFRACFIDSFQGTAAAGWAATRMNARTAYILRNPDEPYSAQLAQAFAETFQRRGGRIAGTGDSREIKNRSSRELGRVKAASPDVVYLPEYFEASARILRAGREAGIRSPFLGADGWASTDFDLAAAEGSFYTDHWSPVDPRPDAVAFRQAFSRASAGGREADSIAALFYDSMNILFAAVRACGSEEPALVRTALERGSFKGVTGEITFDPSHNPLKPAAVIEIRGGKRQFAGSISP